MIHYLIFPYNNFDQLELLVNKIKTKNSKVYIHVEKNVKDFPRIKDVYYIENRYHCAWGWTWILKAELAALSESYKHMKKWDHAVFMSWQCFPIKKIDYIEDYINGLWNKSVVHCDSSRDYTEWVTKYWFYDIDFHLPVFINSYIIKFLSKFKKFDKNTKVPILNVILSELISLILPRRKFISDNYKIYKWSSWCILSYNHIDFILEFLGTDKWKIFLKNYDYTLIPNETFFQTILYNVKKDEIIDMLMWYIDWWGISSSPIVLTMKDFDKLINSDKLFARKFDNKIDKKILGKLIDYFK